MNSQQLLLAFLELILKIKIWQSFFLADLKTKFRNYVAPRVLLTDT